MTLTAAKSTHAQAGATLTWQPVEIGQLGAVRLEPWSCEMAVSHDADLLLAFISTREGGVTVREIHNETPDGLTRNRALTALDVLRAHDRVVVKEETRGRNRQRTQVFFARVPGRD